MVVFTCQHCGESINKPKVDKHYSTRCRFKTPYLTCVDCLKDFNGQEYTGHTQCISEAERYSAKGTIFKEHTGKKKQAQYTEVVQSLLNSKNVTCVQRKLLEVCAAHDNVPRKLKKFLNFMSNVSRQVKHTVKDEEDVFKLLESAWKEEKNNTNMSQTKQNGVEKEGESITTDVNENDSTSKTVDESMKKSIKKRKHELQNVVDDNMEVECDNNSQENEDNINGLTKKQLKKQKKYEKYLIELQTAGEKKEDDDQEMSCDGEFKKISKKSKKQSKNLEKEVNNIHADNGESVEVVEDIKQKKSKKFKMCNGVNGQIDEALTENGQEENQENHININNKNKKKSTKLKKQPTTPELNGNVETEISSQSEINPKKNKRKMEEAIETTEEIKKPRIAEDDNENQTMFDWADVIVRVLADRPDKELSIKRLGKKVIDEYQTIRPDHRSYEDLLAKFNKKVKKTKGVRVLKDKAQLVD